MEFTDALQKIVEKLEKIESDVSGLRSDVSEIKINLLDVKDRLKVVEEQTSKMDRHVDFVDNVYVKVKAPLNYICDSFYTLTGSEEPKQLTDK